MTVWQLPSVQVSAPSSCSSNGSKRGHVRRPADSRRRAARGRTPRLPSASTRARTPGNSVSTRSRFRVDGYAAHEHPGRRRLRGRLVASPVHSRPGRRGRTVFLLANALRWWVIFTLGSHWNVRVMDSAGLGVVTSGPFRFVRHPQLCCGVHRARSAATQFTPRGSRR